MDKSNQIFAAVAGISDLRFCGKLHVLKYDFFSRLQQLLEHLAWVQCWLTQVLL